MFKLQPISDQRTVADSVLRFFKLKPSSTDEIAVLRGCGCGCARLDTDSSTSHENSSMNGSHSTPTATMPKPSSCATSWRGIESESALTNFQSINPSTNQIMASVIPSTLVDYEAAMEQLQKSYQTWSIVPASKRGEIIRQFGDVLRQVKQELGVLVSLEMGKGVSEGLGEVQEIIDVCDFACGLSRALNGSMMPSERPRHVLIEAYHPLGVIGIITAFNFPVAVFGWNAVLALVCGNVSLWKPSETGCLSALATNSILCDVLERNGYSRAISTMLIGAGVDSIGGMMVEDPRVKLLSFTGSTKVGQLVAVGVASRLGKHILELGGNNALIVHHDADLSLAVSATVFGAAGTCGQRCTSTRRLFLHESIYDDFLQRLVAKYQATVVIGDPLNPRTLCGPLHTTAAVSAYQQAIESVKSNGGKILIGGNPVPSLGANFVEPTVVTGLEHDHPLLHQELFAPVLYVVKYSFLEQAIMWNNEVPQGLSSSLFSNNMSNVFRWISATGSDCGIVNCNAGTSGAEIGGAFGGEKWSGGGRECGSDSWKQYCRRVTATVNYGSELPLSQGINFD
eukprot:CAMPEP_0184707980 /NCGR_PEP_ID=MMETSP0313-20130426/37543_1 /TAXON_ID=2792 /ORGANISM="Porphyridium aerugineum, Strain SAG 1380-2" /LENGTH=567 /DNA_ID=CAMNT_0027169561 /DNA_START=144 /DNA_END=1847 /DNA_ORIENTATION=+